MPVFGKSRMFRAIRKNDIAAVKALLDGGYSVYAEPDSSNMNAPMLAASEGRKDILELLLQRGADYAHRFPYWGGRTVLHIAADKGHADIAGMILDLDAWSKSLPDTIDNNCNTALHVAASRGWEKVVELLLDRGFDPEFKNLKGKTPIGLAHEHGHLRLVELMSARISEQQQNAAPEELPKEEARPMSHPECWKLLSADRAAFVSLDEAIGYKLTDIFNFVMRERTTIVMNIDTKAESRETKSFDDYSDKTPLEHAHDRYKALGGRIPRDIVYSSGHGKPKPAAL